MRRVGVVAAVVLVLVLTGQGCEDQASPERLSDGLTTISKNMRGIWNAPGGTSCRWWITSNGTVIHNGNTVAKGKGRVQRSVRAADQSQSVVIGSGSVGGQFHSDKCGGWTR